MGIGGILLFGQINEEQKDKIGSKAHSSSGVVQDSVRKIKEIYPNLLVATDVCMCSFTDHGHCGPLDKNGKINNDEAFGFKNENISVVDSILASDNNFNRDKLFYNIPFLADTVFFDIYYKDKEEKSVIVRSPVPENEKWQYWQKINYSDKGYFHVPTPFTFYTGSHGSIDSGEKSWVEK